MANYPSLPFAYPFGVGVKQWQTLRSEMEMGYVQTRVRTTATVIRYPPNSHANVSSAQVDTFLAFWNLVRGKTDVFTLLDPRDGTSHLVRFAETPVIRGTDFNIYDIDNLVFEEAL